MGMTREGEAVMVKPIVFCENDIKMTLRSLRFKRCDSGIKITPNGSTEAVVQEPISLKNLAPFKNQDLNDNKFEPTCIKGMGFDAETELNPAMCHPDFASPGPMSELDAAALKLQKVYKSYRTRRNLADCAVVVEELWWKALDFASLKRSSISFFDGEKPESAVSRWARARTRAAKVGKGLSKNDKAQKLALQHWLEAIDPRHRYGHNLHFYYGVWFKSENTQPFFYWLDIGDGKEVNLEKCPRHILQHQSVKYLGPNEREAYEVIVEDGKLVYKQSKNLVKTVDGSKWIFVLSTSRAMYVGQKKKGKFQHSSFLAGGATTAAGRLVVKEGVLRAVWPYSGHYLPTEENFKEFISFLQDNHVDLTDVKTYSVDDDDSPSFKKHNNLRARMMRKMTEELEGTTGFEAGDFCDTESDDSPRASAKSVFDMGHSMESAASDESVEQPPCKWTTGAGPRIGCVRDYPSDLQFKALEQVNLPPMDEPPPAGNKGPIPSPRPGNGMMLSPMLANIAFATPTIALTLPKPRKRC